MSRLRATLSASPIDREIQSHVAVAERSLDRAISACRNAQRGDLYRGARVARVRRDLEKALGALQGVHRVVAGYDMDDPDLQPTSPYERPTPVVAAEPVDVPEEAPEFEAPSPEAES